MPWDPEVLEGEDAVGGDRLRDGISAMVEGEANSIYLEVVRELAIRREAIKSLAEAVLTAPGRTISGAKLTTALEEALRG